MNENPKRYLETSIEHITLNIKKFREERNLSQEALAEMVDCSREFINRVENRKEDLSLKLLLRIAYELGVAPDSFFEDNK